MNAHPINQEEGRTLFARMREALEGKNNTDFNQHRHHRSATQQGPTPVRKFQPRNWASYSLPPEKD